MVSYNPQEQYKDQSTRIERKKKRKRKYIKSKSHRKNTKILTCCGFRIPDEAIEYCRG